MIGHRVCILFAVSAAVVDALLVRHSIIDDISDRFKDVLEDASSATAKRRLVEEVVSEGVAYSQLQQLLGTEIASANQTDAADNIQHFSDFVETDPEASRIMKHVTRILGSTDVNNRIFENSTNLRTEKVLFNAHEVFKPMTGMLMVLLQRSHESMKKRNDERTRIDVMFAPRTEFRIVNIGGGSQFITGRITFKFIFEFVPEKAVEYGMDVRVLSGGRVSSGSTSCPKDGDCMSYGFVDRLYTRLPNMYAHDEQRLVDTIGLEDASCLDGGPTCYFPTNHMPRLDQIGVGFEKHNQSVEVGITRNTLIITYWIVLRMGWDVPSLNWRCTLNYALGSNLENDNNRRDWEFRVICQGNNWVAWTLYWTSGGRGAEVGNVFAKRKHPEENVRIFEEIHDEQSKKEYADLLQDLRKIREVEVKKNYRDFNKMIAQHDPKELEDEYDPALKGEEDLPPGVVPTDTNHDHGVGGHDHGHDHGHEHKHL